MAVMVIGWAFVLVNGALVESAGRFSTSWCGSCRIGLVIGVDLD